MKNNSSNGEFQDPLENFDPVTYGDSLERALAEESVVAIQHEPYIAVPPGTTVAQAIEKLAGLGVACLLVCECDKLVGVFSDRDVLIRVALDYEKLKNRAVREVMTTDPVYVYDSDSSAAVLSVMAVSGYRHVPVVDTNHRLVGIVSPQRVTNFLHRHMSD